MVSLTKGAERTGYPQAEEWARTHTSQTQQTLCMTVEILNPQEAGHISEDTGTGLHRNKNINNQQTVLYQVKIFCTAKEQSIEWTDNVQMSANPQAKD